MGKRRKQNEAELGWKLLTDIEAVQTFREVFNKMMDKYATIEIEGDNVRLIVQTDEDGKSFIEEFTKQEWLEEVLPSYIDEFIRSQIALIYYLVAYEKVKAVLKGTTASSEAQNTSSRTPRGCVN